MDEGSYLATFETGPLTGNTFTLQGLAYLGTPPVLTPQALSFSGKVSTDHKTLTLDSANQIQKVSVSNGVTNYQICNVGRVLIRVSE